MPIKHNTRGFQGRAIVSLTPLDGVGRKFRLGNTTSIAESIEVERTARQNFQESGGGELDVNEAITSVTAELTVDDIKPETIAIGMRSEITRQLSGPIEDEAHRAWPGERISLKYIPDPDVALAVELRATAEYDADTPYDTGAVVKVDANFCLCVEAGTSDDTPPIWPTDGTEIEDGDTRWRDLGTGTLTADAHYVATKHGLQFVDGGAGLFVGDHPLPIAVSYTANPQYVLQHFVNSGREFMVEIDGENASDNGLPNSVRYFRAKPSPTSGFNRVSTEFATLTLTLNLLEDSSRVGSGVSKYMEERMI